MSTSFDNCSIPFLISNDQIWEVLSFITGNLRKKYGKKQFGWYNKLVIYTLLQFKE